MYLKIKETAYENNVKINRNSYAYIDKLIDINIMININVVGIIVIIMQPPCMNTTTQSHTY